jgi:hypothetical protein
MMNSGAKLTLSTEELQLVSDPQWILTKRIIIDKVNLILGHLSANMQSNMQVVAKGLPGEVIDSTPKIYRGENYRQLPYVLLDYPRCFEKEHVFAIRTLFWWGHFFSCTLHVSGKHKVMFEKKIIQNLAALQPVGLFIGVNEKEWEHHFDAANYMPLQSLTPDALKKITTQRSFLKLAVKHSLQDWDCMPDLLEQSFLSFLKLVTHQLPIR